MAKIGKKEQKALNERLAEVLSSPEASSEEILELLKKGADPTATVETSEDGPIICKAAKDQPAEIVKLLLDNCDFDVNTRSDDESGPAPLANWAAQNKDTRVLSMLINDYKAECPLDGDENPLSILFFSYYKGSKYEEFDKPFKTTEDFYRYLSEDCHIDDQNIFWQAVLNNCLDFCKFMRKEKDVSLEKENNEGLSAIHLAAKFTLLDADALKWLVEEEGVSPETESSSGMRPIHIAASSGGIEALNYLVNECKVDTSVQSGEGLCPIHYICINYIFLEDAEWFIKACIDKLHFDYTLESEIGWIPLDYAIFFKNTTITRFLVKKYGKDGIRLAYGHAIALEKLEYVEFLSEDCGFDLKKEKWVEKYDYYEYSEQEKSPQEDPLGMILCSDNAAMFKFFFERHFGEKLPAIERIPIATIYCLSHAYSIIDYLVSRYNPKSYLDRLLEDNYMGTWDAFCEAARLNDINLLKYLVREKNVSLENCLHEEIEMDDEPLFPIHAAIKNGNLEMVKYLVEECDADPFEPSKNHGFTIVFAVKENQTAIIDYFVENDIFSCVDAVIAYAIEDRYKEAFKSIKRYCLKEKDIADLFCSLCARKNRGMLGFLKKIYAKYSIDLTHKDESGDTALVKSIRKGNSIIFKWLVETGADIYCHNDRGKTPLHIAALYGKLDIVKYCVEECHMDPNCMDEHGDAVIHSATFAESPEIVDWLVNKAGVDINAKNGNGQTPLGRAVEVFCESYDEDDYDAELKWNNSPAKWLVDHGADIHCIDDNGDSVLHYAAQSWSMTVAKYFIEECHMNPGIKNPKTGKTPADYAKGNGALVRYLHKKEKEYNGN